MLKSRRDGVVWCVSQPDHAAVSGYLAAHWGNDTFRRPGAFAESPDPEALRAETILAIASHDNGWWEWEAAPSVSPGDGLPQDLTEVLGSQQDGMDRWRIGIPRLADHHPWASLLTSYHAWWLYAPRCLDSVASEFSHPLFGPQQTGSLNGDEATAARGFLAEIEALQDDYVRRLQADPATACWVDPEHLHPHVRLLQLLDSLSLSLCSGVVRSRGGAAPGPGRSEFSLEDVPVTAWNDRVTMDIRPAGRDRVQCRPYPFDCDPLPVFIPARLFDENDLPREPLQTFWNACPPSLVRIDLTSGDPSAGQ